MIGTDKQALIAARGSQVLFADRRVYMHVCLAFTFLLFARIFIASLLLRMIHDLYFSIQITSPALFGSECKINSAALPLAALMSALTMTEFTLQQTSSVEQVLLRELNHRINNDFASAISTVSLAAARSNNEDVKIALIGVSDLLHHYADVHHALQMPEDDAPIDAVAYLTRLCRSISLSKLEDRRIKLVLSACPLWLHADQCWRLGMVVYELITNAARHAFRKCGGEIRVELSRESDFVECRVLDNGSAPENIQPGSGLKIVNALTQALDGRFKQRFGAEGSKSIMTFPHGGGTICAD